MDVDAPAVAHFDENTQFEVGSWQVAAFDGLCFVGKVCHSELNGSVLSTRPIIHQVVVVCRLNRCIWYAPCIMLLRNVPRGHCHAGGGGTVSNSV